jgi:hypothetical protein
VRLLVLDLDRAWAFRGGAQPPARCLPPGSSRAGRATCRSNRSRAKSTTGGRPSTPTPSYQSVEDRDGMIANGMEGGMNESYARLDDLVARLAPVA